MPWLTPELENTIPQIYAKNSVIFRSWLRAKALLMKIYSLSRLEPVPEEELLVVIREALYSNNDDLAQKMLRNLGPVPMNRYDALASLAILLNNYEFFVLIINTAIKYGLGNSENRLSGAFTLALDLSHTKYISFFINNTQLLPGIYVSPDGNTFSPSTRNTPLSIHVEVNVVPGLTPNHLEAIARSLKITRSDMLDVFFPGGYMQVGQDFYSDDLLTSSEYTFFCKKISHVFADDPEKIPFFFKKHPLLKDLIPLITRFNPNFIDTAINFLNKEQGMCPISYAPIQADKVTTLPSGYSFDTEAIEGWLRQNNKCPVTMEVVHVAYPNIPAIQEEIAKIHSVAKHIQTCWHRYKKNMPCVNRCQEEEHSTTPVPSYTMQPHLSY